MDRTNSQKTVLRTSSEDLFATLGPAIDELPGKENESLPITPNDPVGVITFSPGRKNLKERNKNKGEGKARSIENKCENATEANKENVPPPCPAEANRTLAIPAHLLSYSQVVNRTVATASPGEFTNVLHVPRQRPRIVKPPSPDHESYPTLEEAKAVESSKGRRRSSATSAAVVVRPNIRPQMGILDTVVPELPREDMEDQKTEKVVGVDNENVKEIVGGLMHEPDSSHQLIIDMDLSTMTDEQGDEESALSVETKGGVPMLTVQEVEQGLFKDKEREQNHDTADGPDVIARLMSKLQGDISRPKSAHGVLIPSLSYTREQGTFPEMSSKLRADALVYVAPPAPEVPTYFRPIPKSSQLETMVPFSAPLARTHTHLSLSPHVEDIRNSTTQQPSFPSSRTLSASSQQPPPYSQVAEALAPTEPYHFRYQKRPLGHIPSFSQPVKNLPLYKRRQFSRHNRKQHGHHPSGFEGAIMASNNTPTRQGGLAARHHPSLVHQGRHVPSMHGVIGQLAPVSGTPSCGGDVHSTPGQAEHRDRLAAIWRDAPGAYSPSQYSRPAAGGGATTTITNPAGDRNSAPGSGSFTPNPAAPAYVPIVFRSDGGGNPGPNRNSMNTASTMGQVSFSEVANLMSILTEHIIAQVNSSRDTTIEGLVARIDALGLEVASLRATQQQFLAQQELLLGQAQGRHAPHSAGAPATIPSRAGSAFVRRPAHHQQAGISGMRSGGAAAAAAYAPPPPPKDASSARGSPSRGTPSSSFSSSAAANSRRRVPSVAFPRVGPLAPAAAGSVVVPEGHWYHRAHPAGGK